MAKRKDILYTVANDGEGRLIRAANAEKSGTFHCTTCHAELLLKKSGNTGKGSKRPHFAHKTNVSGCSAETNLHLVTKQLLAEYITEKIEQRAPIPFTWQCMHCEEEHTGDLGRAAADVKLEHSLGAIRPDILLFNAAGIPVIALEIVVTHSPEPATLTYCQENEIRVIELHLNSDADIECLEKLISRPSVVRACRNPLCPDCHTHQRTSEMTIISGTCWKCHSSMKVV